MLQEKESYLKAALSQLPELTDIPAALWIRLQKESRLTKQPKMSILEGEQDDSGSLWYLVQGVACSTQYDPFVKREQALLLWKKGDLIFQPESFFGNKALKESVQLWDDSILLGISYARLTELLADYPHFSSLLHLSYSLRENRLAQHNHLLSYAAIHRVEQLLHYFPGIQNRVKQELLAQYLHMDRRTFNTCLKDLK